MIHWLLYVPAGIAVLTAIAAILVGAVVGAAVRVTIVLAAVGVEALLARDGRRSSMTPLAE